MPNVTFSSPKQKKDVTVYAVAGNRSTILGLAKEHKIPVDFECQDGNCGSCAVEVLHLGNKQPMAAHLTEKEKTALVPFFLEGVGGVPELMQADGIHPAQGAQQRLLENAWPAIKPLL